MVDFPLLCWITKKYWIESAVGSDMVKHLRFNHTITALLHVMASSSPFDAAPNKQSNQPGVFERLCLKKDSSYNPHEYPSCCIWKLLVCGCRLVNRTDSKLYTMSISTQIQPQKSQVVVADSEWRATQTQNQTFKHSKKNSWISSSLVSASKRCFI